MIKLFLVIKAGALFVHFDIPSAGNYYLFADDGHGNRKVETSNHPTNACHVTYKVPMTDQTKLLWVQFDADKP